MFGSSLNWLFHLFGPLAAALLCVLAFFSALGGWAFGWASQRHPHAAWLPLFAATTAAGLEYFRSEWFPLRFPWITPGTGLGPTWLSPWIGVYGASFLILLGAAGVARGRRGGKISGAILLIALFALRLSPPPRMEPDGKHAVQVTLVQSEACFFESYFAATEKAKPAPGSIVVWPEYAVPYVIEEKPNIHDLQRVIDLAAKLDITIIFGTQSRAGNIKHHNSALTIDRSGILGRHHKNRPVHFFNDGIAGTEAKPVATRHGLLGTTICFDNDFSEVDRRMTANGARALLVPSMDPASWPLQQRFQHHELFRHRAAETGRWIAVAGTSGITCIIDPHGHVHAMLSPHQDGVLSGTIGLIDQPTFYVRFGWLLPWFMLAGAVLWPLALGLRRHQPSVMPTGQ